jgi:hypothetical protein
MILVSCFFYADLGLSGDISQQTPHAPITSQIVCWSQYFFTKATAMETKPGDSEGLFQTTEKSLKTATKEVESTPKANGLAPSAEEVPDPDEDDLDDLDGSYHNLPIQSQAYG